MAAGNASQMSDGAAVSVLLSARKAKELGLRPIARLVTYAVAGVPPEIMGIGPLGCTGAKLTAQILHEMARRGSRYGLVTMCVGGGMGAAGIFERL